MPSDAKSLPSPWREFLLEIDALLAEPLTLNCIGGFVICFFYGLPRPTGYIDYYSAYPANFDLDKVAGPRSPLAKKYDVVLHRVAIVNMPEEYESRLTEMFPGQFRNIFSGLRNCRSDSSRAI
jgi:hypothetical protein